MLLLQACKSSQPSRPKEFYENMETEIQPSTLNLPIRISQSELERNINAQLGEVLYEDDDMRGDGLKIKATKQHRITVSVEGQRVKCRVPVQLWVRKDIAITTVDAEGALVVDLYTDFNIEPNWDFDTRTDLAGYQWTKTPVVRTPLGNLNVTAIADEFIHQFKGEITASIDAELRELFDLKKEVGKAWEALQKPFLLSEEYPTSLLINPTTVGMTPFTTRSGVIEAMVVITALPELFLQAPPPIHPGSELPDFRLIESAQDDGFEINLGSSVPFSEAQRIARENMEGETYTFGSRRVKVEDVELYGQGNKLVVKTKLSGSYRGDVYLIGKPEYNARKNQVELENVEFDFSSKKALLRTAAWLFKGSFKRKVQEELDFHLVQNLELTREAIQQEFQNFALAPGMRLNGELADLSVSHVYIGADAIHVKVGLNGRLRLDIDKIGME